MIIHTLALAALLAVPVQYHTPSTPLVLPYAPQKPWYVPQTVPPSDPSIRIPMPKDTPALPPLVQPRSR